MFDRARSPSGVRLSPSSSLLSLSSLWTKLKRTSLLLPPLPPKVLGVPLATLHRPPLRLQTPYQSAELIDAGVDCALLTPLSPRRPAAPVQLKDLLVNNVNTGLFPESPAVEKPQPKPKDSFLQRLQQAPALYKTLKTYAII